MFKKLATLPILAFSALIEPLEAIAQQTTAQPPHAYYGYGPWHMWNDGFGWHFWWMPPLMVLFFLLVCGAMFLFGHRLCGHGEGSGPHTTNRTSGDPTYSALQILNEHFARGEIQKDEYAEKKAAILSNWQT
jgi:uncharacterized membrane protein